MDPEQLEMKSEAQLKSLKNSRARKLSTLTRTRRRSFIIIEAKGSRTQLGELLKDLDVALDAVQEVHDQYAALLSTAEEVEAAELYIKDVERQHLEAVERIREHLEARKDEAPSTASSKSAISRKSGSSVSPEETKAREAEIQRRLRGLELKRTQERLQLEAQEQDLARRRKLMEATDAHEMAKLEASLQRAALDDLQWERRDDFVEGPFSEEKTAPQVNEECGLKEGGQPRGAHQQCAVFSKSIPKVKLPQFNGNPLEWSQWFGLFQALVDSQPNLSNTEKMVHLQAAVTGLAQKTIAGFLYNPELYQEALAVLKERFGRERDVVRAHLNAMFSAPRISQFSAPALEDFYATVNCTVTVLQSLHYEGDLHSHENLQRVVEKLPSDLRREWSKFEVEHARDTPSLAAFSTWLGGQVRIALNCASSCTTFERRPSAKRTALLTSSERQDVCSCCGETHHLVECQTFLSWCADTRAQFVARQRLCFVCLEPGHRIRNCRYARPCGRNGCVMRHHELLHGSRRVVQGPASYSSVLPSDRTETAQSQQEVRVDTSTKRTVTSTSFPRPDDSVTLLQIVPVRIHGEASDFQDVFALLDPGSQTSLCTDDVLSSLKITGVRSNLCLQNVEGTGVPHSSQRVRSMVSCDANCESMIEVPEAFSVPMINVNPPHITAEQKASWKHVSDLNIHDYKNVEIKLLLGANVLEAILQEEARVGAPGQPVAVKTAFGWTLTGTIRGLVPGRHREVMFIRKSAVDPELSLAVEEWWTTESFGVKVEQKSAKSREDERAEKIMEETTKLVDGRYETGLIWRKEGVQLPNNRAMAVQRLQGLERALLRQPVKATRYQAIIQSYLDLGFARKLTSEELVQYHPRRWFLPHHPVSNPNKPGKLRLVFDAAASFRGTSLNSELLSGPDMLLSLPGVLLRFREERVALVGDIEQMYHQVRVIAEDQASLSFLWREMHQEKPPDTYTMLVTIFGAKCSPASANYVLRRTAVEHATGSDVCTRALDAVHRNFYMDDFLKSEKSVEAAKAIRREVTDLVSKGGFRLTKWRSSSEEVLLDIPEEERAHGGTLRKTESVLGCPWNPTADSLGVRAINAGSVFSKRGVLRAVARLFDPLGLAAPFTLRAKLLVQKLWSNGYGWDDELKDSELKAWMDWVAELSQLEDLVVPRWLGGSGQDSDQRQELHVFSDASESAFGTVAYLRVSNGGEFNVTLVAAKTRVAPLRQISIVRLELQGAVMASRLAASLREELTYDLNRVVFWTDSRVVLRYLNNESRRFHTFVANRVAEIRETSKVEQWYHVPGEQNPADACSRGLTVPELITDARWMCGPEYLKYDEDHWPCQSVPEPVSSTDPEVRVCGTTSTEKQSEAVLPDPSRFSSWLKLKRVVAWMKRFVRNFAARARPACYEVSAGPLSATELSEAETVILRDLQRRHFESEVRALQSGETVKSNSLQHVTPFLDSDGVLRVGGRLARAPLTFASKHPAILPADEQVCRLVIADAHRRVFHSGLERTLTELRSQFWLCRGRSLVKKVIYGCLVCKRRRCSPQVPMMADLPSARFNDERAFSSVGVDYFGPMLVRRARSTEKRYGVLFTCLATRAIHLELAQSLDTDGFLLALRRFLARRGRPRSLFSDNGSNFVGAERQLRESLMEWEQTKIADMCSQQDIQWHFIPPGAPHMGGAWERLVGSVKRALKIVMGETVLTDEVLHTLLTEVESMLNGRPLTYVSSDGRDLEPLTPNHLLLGCANANMSPGRFQSKEVNSRRRWRQTQALADQFWKRWRCEYLPSLLPRVKWLRERRNLKVGDVVLMSEESAPRGFWPLARITEVFPGSDGRVRSVEVKTGSGAVYRRPAAKLCLLEESSD